MISYLQSSLSIFFKRGLSVLFVFFIGISLKADDRTAIERLSVLGSKENLPTRPGSAHVLSEKELQKFNYDDVHQVLRFVPGVNIQDEEGFGLRPNIGLRGAHPHRSKKVTLMEDGVLIAPAPYAAPAAYYFPNLSKVSSIEIFKGVPATRFGPNSIGGAINLVNRINEPGLRLKTQIGSFNFRKYQLSAGVETFGDISIDASRTETTGFKQLATPDGNTGFVRHNLTLRWDKYFVPLDQNINFKLNWSDEVSHETYAGLTRDAVNINPYQRYIATEFDKMEWTHRQLFLSYALIPLKDLRTRLTLYNHGFDRSWNKLNGFGDRQNPTVDIRDVLQQPNLAANNYFYRVLKGEADTALSGNRDVLDVGDNQRRYLSQGVQFNFDYELSGFALEHFFTFFYRYHKDQINRYHESEFFNMVSGRLQKNNSLSEQTTRLNQGLAQAQTVALGYETTWHDLSFNAIVRSEDIEYEEKDRLTQLTTQSEDHLLAPGLGLFYQAFDQLFFLFGVNKAFTPKGPGQAPSILPEEAINYELGLRYTGSWAFELIGFLSDYKNLLGTCTQSGGCDVSQVDQSFNGGEAEVLGVELLVKKDLKTKKINFPIMLSGTFTQAQFANSFASSLTDWGIGDVQTGDPLPYIPDWQFNLATGVEWKKLSIYFNANYMGKMADQAVLTDREYINERLIVGLAAHYQVSHQFKFDLRIDNLTDEKYAVSQRPFGLRPGAPQSFFIGASFGF